MTKENTNIEKHSNKIIELHPIFEFKIFLTKIMVPFFILLVIFVIDAADGDIDDGYLDTQFYIIASSLMILFAGILLPFKQIRSRKSSYTISNDKIISVKKFPIFSKLEIDCVNIKEIIINETKLQKKYGIANLTLVAKEGSKQDHLTLFNLDQINDIKTLITNIIDNKIKA